MASEAASSSSRGSGWAPRGGGLCLVAPSKPELPGGGAGAAISRIAKEGGTLAK